MVSKGRRRKQFKKYSKLGLIGCPNWAVKKTDSELLLLSEIVKNNSNNTKRLSAYEESSLPKETKSYLTKTIFPKVTMYLMAVERSGANFDVDMLRWVLALDGRGGYCWDMGCLDIEITNYIARTIREHKELAKRSAKNLGISYDDTLYDDDTLDVDNGDFIASAIGYGIVLVPAFFIFLAFSGVFTPSQEEREERETIAFDGCVERTESQLSRSCAADPVFTYCSMMYDSYEIIGSGCTSRVKNKGGYSDQIEFCESAVLPGVRRMCAIEVYGCVAVTGDINCN